jgi:hypothetical protein
VLGGVVWCVTGAVYSLVAGVGVQHKVNPSSRTQMNV